MIPVFKHVDTIILCCKETQTLEYYIFKKMFQRLYFENEIIARIIREDFL